MAVNAFRTKPQEGEKPNRIAYDLSYSNSLTMKFGKIYPTLVKEVLPGDSFEIKDHVNVQFMPMMYPITTRMRAYTHYFYVRNRTLWKDWQDFITGTKSDLVFPTLSVPADEEHKNIFKTGGIGDYLGIPTRYYTTASSGELTMTLDNSTAQATELGLIPSGDNVNVSSLSLKNLFSSSQSGYRTLLFRVPNTIKSFTWTAPSSAYLFNIAIGDKFPPRYPATEENLIINAAAPRDHEFSAQELQLIKDTLPDSDSVMVMVGVNNNDLNNFSIEIKYDANEQYLEQDAVNINPALYSGISALPFRAYEAIYNTYFRNPQNNPFVVNGVEEYNKFVTNDNGGIDSTPYQLYNRNWESDQFTTALQNPILAVAPMVGVSTTGKLTFADDNGTYTAQAKFADDGETIVGYNVTSKSMPNENLRMLTEMSTLGFSINDLRNVNSYQRFLENSIRLGLRYRDQIMSHFNVTPKFDTLDMPEFIGGHAVNVNMNSVVQSSDALESGTPLGTTAGLPYAVGSGNRITKYCDEHGFIIGVVSVVPVPQYEQAIPKFYFKNHQLDYFSPEFGHIGLQPILNKEIAFIQSKVEEKANETFGYQRPWYDYLASLDEVHGEFRSTLRSYIMNRLFANTPSLSADLTTVDNSTLTNVFANTDDTDKMLANITFEISKKTCIPLNSVAKLE